MDLGALTNSFIIFLRSLVLCFPSTLSLYSIQIDYLTAFLKRFAKQFGVKEQEPLDY